MIRQMKKIEDDENLAKRMSVTNIGWNVIWNFANFVVFFSYSIVAHENSMLMVPAFFYFMICFLFELKLLLLCWKANNLRLFADGTAHARRALIMFYVKFYLVCLFLVIFIEKIFYYKLLLLLLNGLVWAPQVVKNVLLKSKNVPDIGYILSLTCTQCCLPFYLN